MSIDTEEMAVTSLANWFGSNRMLAEHVGTELRGCTWVGVPFAGGMSELPHIPARVIQVNDRHRHVINLARVAADPVLGPQLYRALRRKVFHPDELDAAQRRCRAIEQVSEATGGLFGGPVPEVVGAGPCLAWAVDYFTVVWMIRHSTGGTPGEFTGGISCRWTASGGGSAKHFHSAVWSLPAWRKVLRRCDFTTLDAFAFIEDEVNDADGVGLYCDPPFPGPGDAYTHTFGDAGQRRLAAAVSRFNKTRVVMRFHGHPLVEELYPRPRWRWVERVGRKQTNKPAAEVLLVNDGPRP